MRRRFLSVLGVLTGAAALSACAAATLNALTSGTGFQVTRNLRHSPGERGTFDLYVPEGAGAGTPLVAFFYGGNWDSGSKDIYYFVGQSLASRGVAVAIPDYRVYPQVVFPGFVEDGARAVAAVAGLSRSGGGGLPASERRPLFLMGHSAGAQIAALLALDERYLSGAGLSTGALAGFIGLAGPYDFLPLTEDRYKRIFPEATRDASQAVNVVGAPMPPMLLVAGTADTTVNPRNTRSLAARARAAGGAVEEILVPGLDHVGAVASFATALPLGNAQVREAVLAFVAARS